MQTNLPHSASEWKIGPPTPPLASIGVERSGFYDPLPAATDSSPPRVIHRGSVAPSETQEYHATVQDETTTRTRRTPILFPGILLGLGLACLLVAIFYFCCSYSAWRNEVHCRQAGEAAASSSGNWHAGYETDYREYRASLIRVAASFLVASAVLVFLFLTRRSWTAPEFKGRHHRNVFVPS